ncbi:hypothetical protein ACIG47_24225 [Promicromonospora sp. NPDC052451]|uniref:hypothetical protein n=1 Tax=unclassified Promicromonospora TaxID=2647929 RepID=UPI0037C6C339
MSGSVRSPSPARPVAPYVARRMLRAGWVLLALAPAAFALGIFLRGVLLTAQGWHPDGNPGLPAVVELRATVPALLVLVVPCCAAAWYGRRAERLGRPEGRDVCRVAGVVAAVSVVLSLAQVLAFWGLRA